MEGPGRCRRGAEGGSGDGGDRGGRLAERPPPAGGAYGGKGRMGAPTGEMPCDPPPSLAGAELASLERATLQPSAAGPPLFHC